MLNHEGTIHFRAKEEQSIVLDTKTKKLLQYRINYRTADVDRKIIAAAEEAVKSMGASKVQPFTNFARQSINIGSEKEVWELSRRIEVKGERSPYKTYVVEGRTD
ncbi:hypothetical protein M5X00_02325 [Paenibacillus alvei]|uniref:Uncharacterized protein n=1 Tax=Paenibacillus alvei TaxID=44250 RepID=A0ABT4GR81_PAEAL|nr:hypothetical protein [Paenibacillus alvei]EJW18674.1 hypothetical protein PAV_2c04400 [Paenibacillus alvei DSM 29]MCY9539838.1 hypothetical protein [Paenibacillus alvei]MCY9703359.1 hypothetical protein [Paenibacillus alvei]MCY9735423.1 hypothetical protein [Paenibacillus alvei]MCY9753099.1 hypothetical protein [Paenibacillus alvei]